MTFYFFEMDFVVMIYDFIHVAQNKIDVLIYLFEFAGAY